MIDHCTSSITHILIQVIVERNITQIKDFSFLDFVVTACDLIDVGFSWKDFPRDLIEIILHANLPGNIITSLGLFPMQS